MKLLKLLFLLLLSNSDFIAVGCSCSSDDASLIVVSSLDGATKTLNNFWASTGFTPNRYATGRRSAEILASPDVVHNLAIIASNRHILRLGLVQALTESSMFVFVYLWTPTLQAVRNILHHFNENVALEEIVPVPPNSENVSDPSTCPLG